MNTLRKLKLRLQTHCRDTKTGCRHTAETQTQAADTAETQTQGETHSQNSENTINSAHRYRRKKNVVAINHGAANT